MAKEYQWLKVFVETAPLVGLLLSSRHALTWQHVLLLIVAPLLYVIYSRFENQRFRQAAAVICVAFAILFLYTANGLLAYSWYWLLRRLRLYPQVAYRLGWSYQTALALYAVIWWMALGSLMGFLSPNSYWVLGSIAGSLALTEWISNAAPDRGDHCEVGNRV